MEACEKPQKMELNNSRRVAVSDDGVVVEKMNDDFVPVNKLTAASIDFYLFNAATEKG